MAMFEVVGMAARVRRVATRVAGGRAPRVSWRGRRGPGRRRAVAVCGGRWTCGCASYWGWSTRAGKCYTRAPWTVSCERFGYAVWAASGTTGSCYRARIGTLPGGCGRHLVTTQAVSPIEASERTFNALTIVASRYSESSTATPLDCSAHRSGAVDAATRLAVQRCQAVLVTQYEYECLPSPTYA